MKKITLNPKNGIFTNIPFPKPIFHYLEELLIQNRLGEIPWISVMKSPEESKKYLIYNGNHTLKFALVFELLLPAYVIENLQDLRKIQKIYESKHDGIVWGANYEHVLGEMIRVSKSISQECYDKKISWTPKNYELLASHINK